MATTNLLAGFGPSASEPDNPATAATPEPTPSLTGFGPAPFSAPGSTTEAPTAQLEGFGAGPTLQEAAKSNEVDTDHTYDVNEPWYSKAWNYLNKPLFDLHRSNSGPIEAGVEDVASSLTSPLSVGIGLATLGGGFLEDLGASGLRALGVSAKTAPIAIKGLKLLMDTGFTEQQVQGLVTQVPAIFDAIRDGDYESATRLATSSVLGGTLASLGALGALKDWGRFGADAGILKPNQTLKALAEERGKQDEAYQLNDKESQAIKDQYWSEYEGLTPGLSKEERGLRLAGIGRWIRAGGDADLLKTQQLAHLGTLQVDDTVKPTQKFMYTAVDSARAAEAERHGVTDHAFYNSPADALKDYQAANPGKAARVYSAPADEVVASRVDRSEPQPDQSIKSRGTHDVVHEVTFDNGKISGQTPVEHTQAPLDKEKLKPGYKEPEATTKLGKLTNAAYIEAYTPAEKDRLVAEYDAAQNLSDPEKAFAGKISHHFGELGAKAFDHGILNHFIDNYLTNTWKPEDQDNAAFNQLRFQSNNGGFDTNFPYAMHRVYDSDFQAEMLGRKKKISDPVALLGNYNHALNKTIASRELMSAIESRGLRMPDGRPIVALSGTGTRLGEESGNPAVVVNPNGVRTLMIKQEYIRMLDEAGELRKLLDEGKLKELKPRELTDPKTGEKTLQRTYGWAKGDYQVIDHPALRAWNYVTDDTDGANVYMKGDFVVHPDAVQAIRQLIGADESAIRKLPGYNVINKVSKEGKHLLLSFSPFHLAQEGLRAVMTGINPFGKMSFDLENDPVLREGVRSGLTLGHAYDAEQEYTSGVRSNSAVLNKIPGLRQLDGYLQQFLFERYIPGLKARAYKALVDRYRALGETDTAMQSAARHTNELFGGLNYRELGRSATTQDLLRLTTLAPDWLESEARLIGRSIGANGRNAAIIANQDNLRIMATLFMGARVLNLLVSGKAHNETPFGVVQDNGPGKDPTVWSVRTLPTDMLHALSDPRDFLANRLNPLTVRTPMEVISGRDEFGRRVPPQNVLATALKNIAPIASQNFFKKLAGFPAELSSMEQVARGFGAAPYKYRSEAEKLARQFESDKMPTGPEDAVELSTYLRDQALIEGVRQGQLSKGALRTFVSKRAADDIVKRANLTPLQDTFRRATMSEALQIYQVATDAEKQQLTSIMWKKRHDWLKQHEPAEREKDPTFALMKQIYPDLE